jgi:hypothetical protein
MIQRSPIVGEPERQDKIKQVAGALTAVQCAGAAEKAGKILPRLLELLLRLEGDIRRRLRPIRVTPSQAGVILFLRRHAEARVSDAATALGVRLLTLH